MLLPYLPICWNDDDLQCRSNQQSDRLTCEKVAEKVARGRKILRKVKIGGPVIKSGHFFFLSSFYTEISALGNLMLMR